MYRIATSTFSSLSISLALSFSLSFLSLVSLSRRSTMADTLGKTANLFSGSLCLSRKRMDFSAAKNFVSVRSASGGFCGQRLVFGDRGGKPRMESPRHAVSAKMSLAIGKAMQWWTKGTQPNMKEIDSAQDLVDSLTGAGDKLVIVDFFSPGCGGCKALHPKICQLAGMNQDVLFLQVNYEEHKSLCYSLNVHVLPFFRFYRGAHGRLCSFSCTNATIKKFKDALAKHSTERCSLGPTKGLEESELVALAANKELSFSYTAKPSINPDEMAEPAVAAPKVPVHQSSRAGFEDKSLVTAGR